MNEHTTRVLAWYRNEPTAQSQAHAVPDMPLVQRGNLLRATADMARSRLVGVDFDAVDWAAVLEAVPTPTRC